MLRESGSEEKRERNSVRKEKRREKRKTAVDLVEAIVIAKLKGPAVVVVQGKGGQGQGGLDQGQGTQERSLGEQGQGHIPERIRGNHDLDQDHIVAKAGPGVNPDTRNHAGDQDRNRKH